MAKKKTHQRNLERARANREAAGGRRAPRGGGSPGLGLDGRRIGVLALVAVMTIGVVVAAFSLRDDDPSIAVEGFDAGDDVDEAQLDEAPLDDGAADDGAADDDPAQDPGTASVDCDGAGAPEPTSQVYDSAPEMTIDPDATYTATIATTCGTVEVELFADGSPTAVNNFVFLAEEGYYEGVPFHRVIDGFMIQGGDPSGTGFGGAEGYPGYTFPDELEFTERYVTENGGYPEGTLAMANAGPDTNGSQFFIMDGQTGLPPQYVVFGRTTAGQDVVDLISQVPVEGDQAIDPPRILSVDVARS